MSLDEDKKNESIEEDVIKRISNANTNGDPWFEIKVIVPYEDEEKEVVLALQNNLEKMLCDGIKLMYAELKEDLPKIILPH